MTRTKRKMPVALMIEGSSLKETLILALDDLANNNKSLKNALNDTTKEMNETRKIITGL